MNYLLIDRPGYDFTTPLDSQKSEAIRNGNYSRATSLRDRQRLILYIGILQQIAKQSFINHRL